MSAAAQEQVQSQELRGWSISKLYDEVLSRLGEDYQIQLGRNLPHENRSTKVKKILFNLGTDQDTQQRLESELLGFGPLTSALADSAITEILVNGDGEVWLEKAGVLAKGAAHFISRRSYENFIQQFSIDTRTVYSIDRPFSDGQWREFRVHLIGPPLCQGFQLSLRRHPHSAWSVARLCQMGWAPDAIGQKLCDLVKRRQSILVVGPTGSGKTSVLNSLIAECDPNERLVVIEDSSEINLPNTASTKLLTRVDPSGALQNYDQSDLLRQALRMRPDRIIVGEARGAEAKDLLMALSTGHQGGLCTLHDETARQALLRLEMMVQLGAPQWSARAIRHLIFFGIQYIVCVKKQNGCRTLDSIHKMQSVEETGFCLERIF